MKIKIYSGIAVSKTEVQKHLPGAHFSGPIKRGDLQLDLQKGYHFIGIIDGLFHSNLAVSPSEILDVMRAGTTVYGASSMGALRAVDLQNANMIGVGLIYNYILQQDSFPEDWLGQLHFENIESASTIALIDLYFLLKDLPLNEVQFRRLFGHYRKLHFSHRNISIGLDDHLGRELTSLGLKKSFLSAARKPLQKKKDALSLLLEINAAKAQLERFNRERTHFEKKLFKNIF